MLASFKTLLLSLTLLSSASASQAVWEADPLVDVTLGPGVGFVVGSVGDLDGDGIRDGLVTSVLDGGSRGRVYAVSSASGGVIRSVGGDTAGMGLGHSVAGLGDVDGDGVADFAAGAPVLAGTRPGETLVFSGATGAEIWRVSGEAPGDFFGWMVACVHDVNGDGIDDVGVGAPGHDQPAFNAGKAYVLSGVDGAVIHAWQGLAANDTLGGSIGYAGDRDGDGLSEVIVCAPAGGPTNRGAGFVYRGSDGALDCALPTPINGRDYGNYFSGCAGDVDADGTLDLYVIDYRVGQRGRVFVYSGVDCSLIYSIRGPEGSTWLFGRVRIGDVDGDGHDDLLLSSSLNPAGGGGAGAVYLYSGASAELIGRWTGSSVGRSLGSDVASVGDVDGDGSPDIFVGVGNTSTGIGGVMVLPTRPAPPRIYCEGSVNSTGKASRLDYRGSLSLGASEFELVLGDAPAGALAALFGGPQATSAPAGDGIRCVAVPAARIGVVTLDASGSGALQPALPMTGPAAAVVGVTWHAQAWYRDVAAGGTGFNLSSALRMTFRP